MPSPWQIFHVSPFLPLCPLPSLSSISVTELPGRRRAAQPPPPPVYEPYTSIYQNPLFSARHGSRRAEEGFDISPIGHTTEKGGILHTWDGHAQLHVRILLSLSLSANFPHIRMEKKRQTNMPYRNSFCWRHGGGGGDISARFRKKGISTIVLRRNYKRRSFFYSHYHHHSFGMLWFFSCSNLLLLCMFRRCLMRGRLMTAEAIETLFIPSGEQNWFKKFLKTFLNTKLYLTLYTLKRNMVKRELSKNPLW